MLVISVHLSSVRHPIEREKPRQIVLSGLFKTLSPYKYILTSLVLILCLYVTHIPGDNSGSPRNVSTKPFTAVLAIDAVFCDSQPQ